jgi:hypothetical protein
MRDATDSYGNPSASDEVTGTRIAWVGSTTCQSCHDAGASVEGPGVRTSSFPHSTPGYYRFMTSSSSLVGDPETNSEGSIDGVCLKCHRADDTTGVGLTY